jgi:hypothetical protein
LFQKINLPEDFWPRDRAQAGVLAQERGAAWYLSPEPYKRRIYFVSKDAPPSAQGRLVVTGNAWSKKEAEDVVQELNRAYYIGLQETALK